MRTFLIMVMLLTLCAAVPAQKKKQQSAYEPIIDSIWDRDRITVIGRYGEVTTATVGKVAGRVYIDTDFRRVDIFVDKTKIGTGTQRFTLCTGKSNQQKICATSTVQIQ